MTAASARIRDACDADARACAEIYAPYVTDTAISFESEPPQPGVMARRIADAVRTHAWLVLEEQDQVIGYAYGGPFRARRAYDWSCEVSVYLERGRQRTGGGRVLYEALLARLAERGFRTVVAGMTLPNEASVGLHRAMGFEEIGTFRCVGWKHGRWRDVAFMQRAIGTEAEAPPELV